MVRIRGSIRGKLMIALVAGVAIGGCTQAAEPQKEARGGAEARVLARSGNKALAEGHAKEANRLFDQALKLIGNRYQKPGTIDDSGAKLVLARIEADKGNYAVSANLKAGVVEGRLDIDSH